MEFSESAVWNSSTAVAPLNWLGYSPEYPAFDEWLTASRIYERPHTAADDEHFAEDRDKAHEGAKLSLIEAVERLGICCVYEHRRNYQRLFGPALCPGNFILKELVFYAHGVLGYQGCKIPLPFGLELGESREQIRRKLGDCIGTRRVHELLSDRYLCEGEYILNVSYEADKAAIIHIRRIHEFDRLELLPSRSPLVEWPPSNYSIQSLIDRLNCPAGDDAFNAMTRPLGWDARGVDMSECHEIDKTIPEHGLALYYRQKQDFLGRLPALELAQYASTFFVGFRVNRAGDMSSNGFRGPLPFNLAFHDAPATILRKMKTPPDREGLSDDIGFFVWNTPNMIVHTMYSLIDMQMYRLSIFSPIMQHEFSCG